MDSQDQVTVSGLSDDVNQQSSSPPAQPDNIPRQLQEIKDQALSQLTPIVRQLDQTPEEHFKMLLMTIQVSDDPSLIKEAYESAQKISNSSEKAEALLDIINEINYFTSPKN
ncbi:MAG: hypothetical protein ACYCPS_01930 [Candidatus Saccharimonadales bacterium]